MLPLVFLFAVLANIVFTCPLSLNKSFTDLNDTLDAGGNVGWLILPDHELRQRLWPTGSNGIVTINYCYANHEAYTVLSEAISNGWRVWLNKIGIPGAFRGHRLSVNRYFTDSSYPWCYENGQWNPKVPMDTLAIKLDPNRPPRASPGYFGGGQPGRHHITMPGHSQSNMVADAAHEWGHVFGLFHEHQRSDRDAHVQFNCVNVIGFNKAMDAARADGHTQNDLCTKLATAAYYGFAGTEFIKYVGDAHGSSYDSESIMHYDSWGFHDPDLVAHDPLDPDLYPLVRFGYNGEKELIPKVLRYPNLRVSDGDRRGILRLYPWGRN